MTLTKITFKVPPGLWAAFVKQADALYLKRGAFLDHMIKGETKHLAQDMKGRRLSSRGRRYIAGELKRRDPLTVNVEVAKATADQLNEVVEASNLVRDAFLCRLLVFLRSTNSLLKQLDVPQMIDDRRFRGVLESMPTSPLLAMEALQHDPLFYIRTYLHENDRFGVYSVPLGPKFDWMACYLEDKDIPGTTAFEEDQAMWKELESAPSSRPASAKKGE